MAKYVFYTTMLEYGRIEVEAENEDKAKELAWQMEGRYYPNSTEVSDIELKRD